MQELTLETMFAVLQEMFGAPLFWGLVAAAVLVTVAYIAVLVRDRAVSWRKFLLAQLSMPVGAVAAVAFLMAITSSSPSDLGGPIDLIVLLGVAAAGAIGMAILVYTVQSLLRPPRG
ncbi:MULTISPECIES: DUF5368 domain-containing protein [Devosiaceae]|uniref:DUF5368 domain-containing protein n=1 Tax=Devosia ginsengisoli TaxID=400770 RepID=A0A5B8LWU3_9HYPH|nr:DUF5368 domain-containing protein [Devosia ginsengisoli]QDZ12573.1 hypothetical protein FPZ08_18575 [Devosia ginsengisoli]